MDRKRIASKYARGSFVPDMIAILIVWACPISTYYYLNFSKLFLILKLSRLSEIDDYYIRRLNIHRKSKAAYVIFKLTFIIFLLSHLISLGFYALDYELCASGKYQQ